MGETEKRRNRGIGETGRGRDGKAKQGKGRDGKGESGNGEWKAKGKAIVRIAVYAFSPLLRFPVSPIPFYSV